MASDDALHTWDSVHANKLDGLTARVDNIELTLQSLQNNQNFESLPEKFKQNEQYVLLALFMNLIALFMNLSAGVATESFRQSTGLNEGKWTL